MSQIPLCTIRLSSQLTSDEISSLETSLELASIHIQKDPKRAVGVDDIVLVLSGLAAAAKLVESGAKVASVINKWRKNLRSQGKEPQAKLEHPRRPLLDLKTASDEEVERWLSQED